MLEALESASRRRIDPHLEPIELRLGDIICEAGGLLKHAYFPEGAVLSLLTVLENGSAIETANILPSPFCIALNRSQWWRQEGVEPLPYDGVALAGCLFEARTIQNLNLPSTIAY